MCMYKTCVLMVCVVVGARVDEAPVHPAIIADDPVPPGSAAAATSDGDSRIAHLERLL